MTRSLLGGLLAATFATSALAQGFSGAEISAEIGARTDDFDLGSTLYAGGAEFGFTPNIGIAAGFSNYGLRGLDGSGSGYSLHGLYRMGNGIALGLFLGRDTLQDTDYDFAGVEAATNLSGLSVEGYFGQYQGGGEGSFLGVEAAYLLQRGIEISGSFDTVAGDTERTRLALGGAYRFGNGPQVFAELGTMDDAGDGGTFLTLGAKIGLGPNGGTTFGQRGLLQSLGGF